MDVVDNYSDELDGGRRGEGEEEGGGGGKEEEGRRSYSEFYTREETA